MHSATARGQCNCKGTDTQTLWNLSTVHVPFKWKHRVSILTTDCLYLCITPFASSWDSGAIIPSGFEVFSWRTTTRNKRVKYENIHRQKTIDRDSISLYYAAKREPERQNTVLPPRRGSSSQWLRSTKWTVIYKQQSTANDDPSTGVYTLRILL